MPFKSKRRGIDCRARSICKPRPASHAEALCQILFREAGLLCQMGKQSPF
jgi:hypothetical protein